MHTKGAGATTSRNESGCRGQSLPVLSTIVMEVGVECPNHRRAIEVDGKLGKIVIARLILKVRQKAAWQVSP